MCSGTDYYGWMCDDCYAKVMEDPEAELCPECRARADQMDIEASLHEEGEDNGEY